MARGTRSVDRQLGGTSSLYLQSQGITMNDLLCISCWCWRTQSISTGCRPIVSQHSKRRVKGQTRMQPALYHFRDGQPLLKGVALRHKFVCVTGLCGTRMTCEGRANLRVIWESKWWRQAREPSRILAQLQSKPLVWR